MADRIASLRARIAGLTPAEREALRARVEAAGVDWARVALPEPGAPRPVRIPLSPAQMHFWLLQQVHPESAAFTIAFAWEVDGPLDRDALGQAIEHLVDRHEPLRTAFPSEDGHPWQKIATEPGFRLEEVDHSSDPTSAGAAERDFVARPFDLSKAPLFRAQLQALAPERHRLLFAFHHIVADGWSRGIFLRELVECYRAFRARRTPILPPLPRQFADLVLDQTKWLESSGAREQEAFWRNELAGLAPQELPARAPSADRAAATALREVDPALASRIVPAAAALGVSPFLLLLATFQLLLHRLTGSDDIAVGTPIAGRTAPDADGIIGLFVNTLVLRARPRGDMSFRAWLDHVRQAFARAFEHQELPFARIVQAVGAERRAGQNPLFQTLFQVQSGGYGHQNAKAVDLGDPRLSIRQRPIPLAQAKFDLSWHMIERPGALSVIVEYRPGLFDADWIGRMVRQFETLLAAALDRPDAAIAELDFVPAEDSAAAILRGPDAEIPCLTAMIAAQVAPGKTALICERTGESWSGPELDAAAERLAQQLRARPELADPAARIAICLPRGPWLVIALLAALKSGIAYVPLDPAHPAERRDLILTDADVGLMLAADIPDAPCPVLDPGSLGAEAPQADLPAFDAERIAYLIYTSGSTGRPKGVPISHRALSNLIAAMAARPGLRPGDRLLALTTVAFDIAALEIFLPLATGAVLVLGDGEIAGTPDRLAATLDRHGITHMQATPATWRLLIDGGWQGRDGLTALCGGEALPADLGRALLERTAALWNMYGPTETTIWSAALRVTGVHLQGPQARIGGPIANTTLRVLDGYGTPLPPGLPGELAIGGAGLSPGYWNRPDLSAERFVSSGGARLYRTGDRVRLETDGTLSFLGRLDHQIKLNGHRIEPGEVEAALTALPGIAEALVLVDAGRLVAYLRAAEDTHDPAHLRAHLARRLPAYMMPATFVMLDAFPLNANGKIDRARLPRPGRNAGSAGRAPETPAEKTLQALWAEVLGYDDIGAEENFFDLGGASVSAMQIASRARARGLHLTPAQMFELQTIAAQAAAAEAVGTAATLPFSPWQRACLSEAARPWHLRLPLEPGQEGRLADAAAAMSAAHPALRFAFGPDGWRTEAANVPDISGGGDDCARGAFDEGTLWRARIVDGALEVVAHPLLLDARSVEQLATGLLARLRGGREAAVTEGYARWLESGPADPAAAMLTPFPADGTDEDDRPVVQSLEAASRGLGDTARTLNVPPTRIAAAALARTLSQWRGGGSVSLALIEDAPAEALGNFTRLMPLRFDAVPASPAESIRAVERAAAASDPRGVAPRTVPAGAAVLSWRSLSAAGWLQAPEFALPAPPALHVEAVAGAASVRLTWRFDAGRLRRATVARLAARHLAELVAPLSDGSTSKLDRLRARLRESAR